MVVVPHSYHGDSLFLRQLELDHIDVVLKDVSNPGLFRVFVVEIVLQKHVDIRHFLLSDPGRDGHLFPLKLNFLPLLVEHFEPVHPYILFVSPVINQQKLDLLDSRNQSHIFIFLQNLQQSLLHLGNFARFFQLGLALGIVQLAFGLIFLHSRLLSIRHLHLHIVDVSLERLNELVFG